MNVRTANESSYFINFLVVNPYSNFDINLISFLTLLIELSMFSLLPCWFCHLVKNLPFFNERKMLTRTGARVSKFQKGFKISKEFQNFKRVSKFQKSFKISKVFKIRAVALNSKSLSKFCDNWNSTLYQRYYSSFFCNVKFRHAFYPLRYLSFRKGCLRIII